MIGVGFAILHIIDFHSDLQRVVVETAVNFKSNIFTGKIIISHIAKEIRDHDTLFV